MEYEKQFNLSDFAKRKKNENTKIQKYTIRVPYVYTHYDHDKHTQITLIKYANTAVLRKIKN